MTASIVSLRATITAEGATASASPPASAAVRPRIGAQPHQRGDERGGRRGGGRARGAGRAPMAAGRGRRAARTGLRGQARRGAAARVRRGGAVVVRRPARATPRAFGLGLLGGAFLASALAWLLIVTVVPLHPRPWALGASDGSPWRAALVYNGTARLLPRSTASTAQAARPAPAGPSDAGGAGRAGAAAREHAAALARRPTPPGPLRLLSAHAHLGRWIGFEAVTALAARRRPGAAPGATGAGC